MKSKRGLVLLLAAVLWTGAAGCEEAPDAAAVNVVNAWVSAGLNPEGFEAAKIESLGDKALCKQGKVSGLEATVCQYPDVEAARAAHKAGLAQVGKVTGLALTSGNVLLIVADRDNQDPAGRKINEVVKVFRESAPREKDDEAAEGEAADQADSDKGDKGDKEASK